MTPGWEAGAREERLTFGGCLRARVGQVHAEEQVLLGLDEEAREVCLHRGELLNLVLHRREDLSKSAVMTRTLQHRVAPCVIRTSVRQRPRRRNDRALSAWVFWGGPSRNIKPNEASKASQFV